MVKMCFSGCVQMMWYNSSDEKGPPPSNTNHEPSGAYIFRPNGAVAGTALVPVTIVEGPVLTEIRQVRIHPSR